MSPGDRRRECVAAEARLRRAQDGLHAAVAALRSRVDRHGPATIVGIGAAGGAVAGRLPLRGLLRVARIALDASLLLMRLPAGMLAAAARCETPRNGKPRS